MLQSTPASTVRLRARVCLCALLSWISFNPGASIAYRDVFITPYVCPYSYPPLRSTCIDDAVVTPIPSFCYPPVRSPSGQLSQKCELTGDGMVHPLDIGYRKFSFVIADRDIRWDGTPAQDYVTRIHAGQLTLRAGRDIASTTSLYHHQPRSSGSIQLFAGGSVTGTIRASSYDPSASAWSVCAVAPVMSLASTSPSVSVNGSDCPDRSQFTLPNGLTPDERNALLRYLTSAHLKYPQAVTEMGTGNDVLFEVTELVGDAIEDFLRGGGLDPRYPVLESIPRQVQVLERLVSVGIMSGGAIGPGDVLQALTKEPGFLEFAPPSSAFEEVLLHRWRLERRENVREATPEEIQNLLDLLRPRESQAPRTPMTGSPGFVMHEMSGALASMVVSFPVYGADRLIALPFVSIDVGDGDWLAIMFDDQVLWSTLESAIIRNAVNIPRVDASLVSGRTGRLSYVLGSTGLRTARILVPSWNMLVSTACALFADVELGSAFCSSVEWMKNRGITTGCAAESYCPQSGVSRLSMAAFMQRLGQTMASGGAVSEAQGNYLDPDAAPVVCSTGAVSPVPFARNIAIDVVIGLVGSGTGSVAAQLVWSPDGASWVPVAASIPSGFRASHWSNAWLQGSHPADAGETVRLGVRIARHAGTSDIARYHCRIRLVPRGVE